MLQMPRTSCIWQQKPVPVYSQKFRRDNWFITSVAATKKSDLGYRGPAKVIAIEKGQSGAPMVAWLRHAGTLIRAAPEHLRARMALAVGGADAAPEESARPRVPDAAELRLVQRAERAAGAAVQRKVEIAAPQPPPESTSHPGAAHVVRVAFDVARRSPQSSPSPTAHLRSARAWLICAASAKSLLTISPMRVRLVGETIGLLCCLRSLNQRIK